MDLLILDFLNSSWLNKFHKDSDKDILFNKEWFQKQLALWNLNLEAELSNEQITDLIQLRNDLRKAYDQLIAHELDLCSFIPVINKEMQKIPLFKKIIEGEECRTILVPYNYNYDWLKYNILSSFADLITVVDVERLRVCENPDCRFVFYDNSRNATKRHCHSGCSNLMKARRFRERAVKK
jgi:predicted RNA-binding Zn ribbon-like protein